MNNHIDGVDYIRLMQNFMFPALKTGSTMVVDNQLRVYFSEIGKSDVAEDILKECAEQMNCEVSQFEPGCKVIDSVTLIEVLMTRYDPNPDF